MFALIFLMCVIVILIWYNNNDDEGSWEFETKVVKGNGKFRLIDWRTANLEKPPPHVKQPGLYSCISNYGQATLFKHTNGFAEVHIHKFDKDIYDQTIKLKNFEKHEFPIEIIDRN
tara:strand:+ start:107 stop:454 length:348 start_codon:yes stop_codon:yes gene_type:complete